MKPKPDAVLRHVVPVAAAALFLVPLLWIASGSLRMPGLPPPRGIEWLPQPLSLASYGRLFDLLPLGRYLANSLLVVSLAVPLTIVTASWAGFAMAQLGARARARLVVAGVALLLVPVTAVWLTRFVLFAWIGLVDTPLALVAPAVAGTSPLFVLLYYRAFRRVPTELWEQAALEGATVLQTWRRIALPLVRPTTGAIAVLAFLWYWSDFLSPLLYLKRPELYTVPLALRQLEQLDRTNWPVLLAGSVVLAAPCVIAFLAAHRLFLREAEMVAR